MKFTSSGSDPRRKGAKTSRVNEESIPYTVALFSARELYYENQVLTRPGFLAESLYHLADKCGTKSQVSCHNHLASAGSRLCLLQYAKRINKGWWSSGGRLVVVWGSSGGCL